MRRKSILQTRMYRVAAVISVVFIVAALAYKTFYADQAKHPSLPVQTTLLSDAVQESKFKLWNLSLGGKGLVYGSRKNRLYQIVENGQAIKELYTFSDPINAIHERKDGLIIVATDDDRRSAEKPCRIYRSLDAGKSFSQVKQMEDGGTALWWSIGSDKAGRLYLAEYGPQQKGMSKNLWRSDNDGEDWRLIFQAPNKEKTHLHRIAVDPYTDDVWLTIGDGKNRAMLQSKDHGENWQVIADLQATAVAFDKQAIYWGKDEAGKAGVLRYDRKTQTFEMILDPAKHGNFGGSIYDIALLETGELIVPFMKYPKQNHVASVWRGRVGGKVGSKMNNMGSDKGDGKGDDWQPVFYLASEQGKGAAIETIAGPDKNGWVYFTGYQIQSRL